MYCSRRRRVLVDRLAVSASAVKERLSEWLNETFPTRVLVAFASGLAAVVLWKALEGLVG
jgi:hypothetical protein